MKKIMFAIAAIAFFGTNTMLAQDASKKENKKAQSEVAVQQDEQKEGKEIKVQELPKEVQTKLKDKNYAEWQAQKAWVLKDNTYLVEVKNGEKSKKIRFNEDGSEVM